MTLFWYCFVWIAWCAMHSILIDPLVVKYFKNSMGGRAVYYRLTYNVLSLLTLLPLLVITWIDRGDVVFAWSGWTVLIRLFLFLGAMVCFLGGAKGYDLQNFLGLKQIREGRESLLMGDHQSFSEAGVFGFLRHPWYLGTFLFVWSIFGTYYEKNFACVLILSCYLVLGTYLEERKILAEHGDMYRAYQARVSMFFPVKWLLRRYF